MKLVHLQSWVTDHEIVESDIDILSWIKKRLLREMLYKWPVKNEHLVIEYDHIRRQYDITIMAEWKEPVQ